MFGDDAIITINPWGIKCRTCIDRTNLPTYIVATHNLESLCCRFITVFSRPIIEFHQFECLRITLLLGCTVISCIMYRLDNKGVNLNVTFWHHMTGPARKRSKGLNPVRDPNGVWHPCGLVSHGLYNANKLGKVTFRWIYYGNNKFSYSEVKTEIG